VKKVMLLILDGKDACHINAGVLSHIIVLVMKS